MQGFALRMAMTASLLLALGLSAPAPAQTPPADDVVLFSVGGFKRLTADARGRTAVRVVCEDTSACSGVLTIAGSPTRRPSYASAPYRVPAGSAAKVRMTLSKLARRKLIRSRKFRVIVYTTVVDEASNFSFVQLPTMLALVKRKRG